jgi:hypothetical protein
VAQLTGWLRWQRGGVQLAARALVLQVGHLLAPRVDAGLGCETDTAASA